MKPLSSGRVRLRSTDPGEPPVVERGFLSREEDLAPLLEGIELARAIGGAEPLRDWIAAELSPGATDAERYVRDTIRNYFHPAGTCPLGTVVDTHGRVFGTDGLYVADASVMPTIPRANTNLTTAAIAEKLAAEFAEDLDDSRRATDDVGRGLDSDRARRASLHGERRSRCAHRPRSTRAPDRVRPRSTGDSADGVRGTAQAGAAARKPRVPRIARMDPARLEEVFREKPAIHRFPGAMARRVQDLCAFVEERYDGDAAAVWTKAADSEDLRARIAELPGFGEMKIKALGSVLPSVSASRWPRVSSPTIPRSATWIRRRLSRRIRRRSARIRAPVERKNKHPLKREDSPAAGRARLRASHEPGTPQRPRARRQAARAPRRGPLWRRPWA